MREWGGPKRVIKGARPVKVQDSSNWTWHSESLIKEAYCQYLSLLIVDLADLLEIKPDGLQMMFRKQIHAEGRINVDGSVGGLIALAHGYISIQEGLYNLASGPRVR